MFLFYDDAKLLVLCVTIPYFALMVLVIFVWIPAFTSLVTENGSRATRETSALTFVKVEWIVLNCASTSSRWLFRFHTLSAWVLFLVNKDEKKKSWTWCSSDSLFPLQLLNGIMFWTKILTFSPFKSVKVKKKKKYSQHVRLFTHVSWHSPQKFKSSISTNLTLLRTSLFLSTPRPCSSLTHSQ